MHNDPPSNRPDDDLADVLRPPKPILGSHAYRSERARTPDRAAQRWHTVTVASGVALTLTLAIVALLTRYSSTRTVREREAEEARVIAEEQLPFVERRGWFENRPRAPFDNMVRMPLERWLDMPAASRPYGAVAVECIAKPVRYSHTQEDGYTWVWMTALPADGRELPRVGIDSLWYDFVVRIRWRAFQQRPVFNGIWVVTLVPEPPEWSELYLRKQPRELGVDVTVAPPAAATTRE
ncbi:MAG: hypothetical protein AB7S36_06110 [Planctomycetota bacterium]